MIEGWRERLLAAIDDAVENRGLKKTKLGPKAGLGRNWENDFRNKGKDPSLPNLAAVCKALNVSLSYVVFGYDITPEEELVLALYRRFPPSRRESLQSFLQAFQPDGAPPPPPPPSDQG